MKLVRGLSSLSSLAKRQRVVSIGNFDGVHLGHQSIFRQLKQQANEKGFETCVVLFEPQPQEFFSGQDSPARLTSRREKLRLLQQQGMDAVVCLRFDQALSQLSAEQFVRKILLEGLNTGQLIVGDDFRFGIKRQAGFDELKDYGQSFGFEVEQSASCLFEGRRISSSWIRELLAASEFQQAESLLGRAYRISGRVRHGDKRGRELGFPTLNLSLNRINSPLKGVFVSSVIMDNADGDIRERWPAVSNIGTRPVFDGEELLLETHILDYDQNLYGHHVSVEFHKKLRGEEKFNGIAELKKQIARDVEKARKHFHHLENTE